MLLKGDPAQVKGCPEGSLWRPDAPVNLAENGTMCVYESPEEHLLVCVCLQGEKKGESVILRLLPGEQGCCREGLGVQVPCCWAPVTMGTCKNGPKGEKKVKGLWDEETVLPPPPGGAQHPVPGVKSHKAVT